MTLVCPEVADQNLRDSCWIYLYHRRERGHLLTHTLTQTNGEEGGREKGTILKEK